MASTTRPLIFALTLLIIYTALPLSLSQTTTSPAPSSDADLCNGVFITYAYTTGKQIPPTVAANKAYRFESTLTVLNNGNDDLKSWKVFVGFQHSEYLVSASNAVLTDGSSFPRSVGNVTVFAGYPQTDLKSAIKTTGDLTQMQVQVDLIGTQWGVKPPNVPLPANISLANDGYRCPKPSMQGSPMLAVQEARAISS